LFLLTYPFSSKLTRCFYVLIFGRAGPKNFIARILLREMGGKIKNIDSSRFGLAASIVTLIQQFF
ncbi:MAG: hypothetical protein ACI8RD_011235, partial [Bacillariaceae sp.]